jgi:hypothetical protein
MRDSSSNYQDFQKPQQTRGGEKKVMKKSLSVLLSVAMSVSMFASVAFGADADAKMDTQAKYDALHAQGIFDGVDGGAAALDQNMTRAQFAKVLTLVFGLKEATGNSYTDLDGAGWAAGYIEAVTKAGLMDGVAVGKFDPSGNITMEQLATVLVRGFKLQQSTDAVSGTVSDWAKGYVAAAIKAGLIAAKSDFTKSATRSDLVESAYTAVTQAPSSAETKVSFSASAVQEITATFNNAVDTAKVTFDVTTNGYKVNVSKVTWSKDKKVATLALASKLYKGDYDITAKGAASKDLTGKVTVDDQKIAKIEIASDTAPAYINDADSTRYIDGVYVYYKAVDQYGTDITKTASINWNSSVSANINNYDTGVLRIDTNSSNYDLRIGDKFTLTGVETTSNTVISKVLTVGDRSSASNVTVKSLYSADGKTTVDTSNVDSFVLLLDVKDQYGNPVKARDLNGANGQLIVNSSNPTLAAATQNGLPQFTDNAGPNANELGLQLYKSDQQGYVVGGTVVISFIPRYGGASTSYNLEVQKGAQADAITLSQPAEAVGAGEVVEIPFTAVDQNGKPITKYTDLTDSSNGVMLTPSGNSFYFEQVPGSDDAVLKYVAPTTTGLQTITAVTRSGKVSTLTIDVKDQKVPASVTALTANDAIEAAEAAGQTGGTVFIRGDRIKVTDQFGGNFAVNNAEFYDNYKIRVELYGGFATGSGNVVLQDANNKTPVTIGTGTSVDGTVSNVTYFDLNQKDDWVALTANTANNVNGSVKFTILRKNPQSIDSTRPYHVVVRNKYGNGVTDFTQSSTLEVPFRIVKADSIKGYDMNAVPKLFDEAYDPNASIPALGDRPDTGDNYNANLNVYGKLADGSKVSLNPNNNHVQIISGTPGIEIEQQMPNEAINGRDVGKVSASGVKYANSNDQEMKGQIIAIVKSKDNTSTTITKDVTVSRELPVGTKIAFVNKQEFNAKVNMGAGRYSFVSNGSTIKTTPADLTAEKLLTENNAIQVKDQYNKRLTKVHALQGTFTVSSVKGNVVVDIHKKADGEVLPAGAIEIKDSAGNINVVNITNAAVGDSFSMYYVSKDGVVANFKVQVVSDNELNPPLINN